MHAKKRRRAAHSAAVLLGVMTAAVAVSYALSRFFADNNPFAAPVFILAVALISLLTDGYFYGIAASVLGVLCVNIVFTYPFWEFNLSIAGYPLDFTVMLMVSVIISTLTTRVKMQEQLRFEARSEKMRANLLRAVSHDIRTPLASILGASGTLLENDALPPADREELLREIQKDARWLVRMTENLLSVTKCSDGGVALQKSEEVVEEIVGSAIVKFRKNHPALPVTVEKPAEILLVPMDATLIEQVLVNLLENAATHAKTATQIWIRVAHGDRRVTFQVADNGEGIAPQLLPRIFDGGVLGREAPDGRRSMGIGLSVCSSIIRAHGGEMSAANGANGGAEICFWLPWEEETSANGTA